MSTTSDSGGFSTMLLTVGTSETVPGVVTVEAAGEIDLATRHLFDSECARALAAGPQRLALDLRGVGFCGACALAALVELRERCDDNSVELEICPSRIVRRALDIVAATPSFRLTGPWSGEGTTVFTSEDHHWSEGSGVLRHSVRATDGR
jgi:anti-anti-sigma factor